MSELDAIQNYLLEHIPLTKALGAKLVSVSEAEVIVSAPFDKNINHKKTIFGGSLHAIATLACWSLMYKNFISRLGEIEIVISHSEVNYLQPVTSDFQAICTKPDEKVWSQFVKTLSRRGRSRIKLASSITENGKLAVNYIGSFVVLSQN